MTQSLYDRDFLLWIEDTVAKLRARDFEHLDLEHLIEEVDSLGISQRKELLSRLIVLLEHLLKRLYVHLPENYRGWESTIRNQRTELDVLLSQAPSLRGLWNEYFADAWRRALLKVKSEYKSAALPSSWSYSSEPEEILSNDLWEEQP